MHGPTLVGLTLRTNDHQIFQIDPHRVGRRRIKTPLAIHDRQRPSFSAGFAGGNQGQAAGPAARLAHPLRQRARRQSSPWQEPIQSLDTRRNPFSLNMMRAFHPPDAGLQSSGKFLVR
jgi:hypothetical protein